MGRPCGDMIHIYAMKEEVNIYAAHVSMEKFNHWMDESIKAAKI